jgi:ribonucleoside-diphosphate reductase alpha chain
MEFVPGYRLENAPRRSREESVAEVTDDPAAAESLSAGERAALLHVEPPASVEASGPVPEITVSPEARLRTPITAVGTTTNGNGSGHGNGNGKGHSTPATAVAGKKLLAKATNPLNQQGSDMQSDAPACDVCGSITVRSGTCYKCLNCGNSMGCS